MENVMKKMILFVIGVFFVVGTNANAQTAASATWSLLTNATAAVSGNVTASNESLNGGDMSVTVYCSSNTAAQGAKIIMGTVSGVSWSTANSAVYIDHKVAPTNGNSFTVSSVSLYVGFSGTGNGAVEIDYSSDGSTFSPLTTAALPTACTVTSGTTVATTASSWNYPFSFSLASNNVVANGQSFVVRVLPWLTATTTGATKAMLIKGVVVSGTTSPSTSVDNETGVSLAPKKLTLENYPNPFNPSTNIRFTVKESGVASVKVYNVLGKLVATLYNGQVQAGEYKTVSFGGNYASGIYYYTINSSTGSLTKKMLLLK
jgi:hypothetical protein